MGCCDQGPCSTEYGCVQHPVRSASIGSLPLAFAAGAVIAALADTIMPEAFEHGGPAVALSTAAGFVLSFVLSLA